MLSPIWAWCWWSLVCLAHLCTCMPLSKVWAASNWAPGWKAQRLMSLGGWGCWKSRMRLVTEAKDRVSHFIQFLSCPQCHHPSWSWYCTQESSIKLYCPLVVVQTGFLPENLVKRGIHGWSWVWGCYLLSEWCLSSHNDEIWVLYDSLWRWRPWVTWAKSSARGETHYCTVSWWELFSCKQVQIICMVHFPLVSLFYCIHLLFVRLKQGQSILQKKSQGHLIHVSDFINEEDGCLVQHNEHGDIVHCKQDNSLLSV